ncbi:uncharacterized protein LOC125193392 isoform X2 [Salvia hispanica]|uniref:uncharacterized protein LOC125193392 isoform X2 n=1 Tax=Salvia hispanica TaxID=49212 RepID=UPI0020098405|nr:uncharacterized protein LOC125193392 isoform X2 [Salvia hispanica]
MASKGRRQCKKNVRLQDEPNISHQRLTNPEDFTTRTTLGRRVYTRNIHQEESNTVTHSNHEDMSIDIEQEEDEDGAFGASIVEKESRGPTYMKNIWGRPLNLPLMSVEYNEFGQPIGGEKSKLCHFLGTIARNGHQCPLDIKSWHAMPKENKDEMLNIVKSRFEMPIIAEKWILASIGLKWRTWKHHLKPRYWADVSIEHLIHDRDDRVSEDQWINLLAYWRTDKAKTKEQGRCPTRAQLFRSCFVSSNGNSSDVVSSKITAMAECRDQLSEDSENVIAPNDIFAQVIGKDKPGQVRIMGQGVCPSDVWNGTPINTSDRLLSEYREKNARLEAMLGAQQRPRASQADARPNAIASESLSLRSTTAQTYEVGKYVSLRSIFTQKIVAKGFIQSIDPNKKVGGQMLGLNWCEISVKVVIEPKEQLIRPYDNFQELSQTIGDTVAWPCSLVTPIE